MYRRRYLVAAGSALLLAGCSGGEADEDPTETTSTPTETPTASATDTPTETATETSTETDTETETESTPSEAEVAAEHLTDARGSIKTAHSVYLSQGGGAETIADVGPAVTDFSSDRIVSECDDALSALDEISDDPPDDVRSQESQLRSAANWLQALAQLQAAMSDYVEGIEAVGSAARRRLDYGEIRIDLEAANDGLDAIGNARVGMGDPSVPAFESIEGIDADATATKDDMIYREAVAFEGMRDYLEDAMTGVDDLEGADQQLTNGQPESAESQASDAARALESARDGVEGSGPDSFAPVAEAFVATMEDILAIADEILAEAREQQSG